MAESSCTVNLHILGSPVRVESQDKGFLAFCAALSRSGSDSSSGNTGATPTEDPLHVEVDTGHWWRTPPTNLNRLGTGVCYGSDTIWIDEGARMGVAVHGSVSANGWHVRIGRRGDRLRWLASMAAPWRYGAPQAYATLYRQGILLPVVADLVAHRGWAVLHAAAVSRGGRAILLTGLNGCGKSSLAWHLVRNKGYRFLSDNYVAYEPASGRVYGIPEGVRLAEHPGVDPSALGGRRLGRTFGKAHFLPAASSVVESGRVRAVAILSLGREANIEPMTPATALDWIEAIHRQLGETPEYGWVQLAYQILQDVDLRGVSREGRKKLCESHLCCKATIPLASSPDVRYDKIGKDVDALIGHERDQR